jgi:hypothetical protein
VKEIYTSEIPKVKLDMSHSPSSTTLASEPAIINSKI